MSDHISIDFDRVAQSVQTIEQASQEIRAILDQLDADLAHLSTQWAGDAYRAYVAMRAQWESQMRGTQTRLSAYARVMEEAGGTIAEQERSLARTF